MENKKERIRELVEYLNKCAHSYYVIDNPIIEDSEYDKLYDELITLEKETNFILENSPTQRVGDVILSKFEKSVHKSKMWSLDKVTSFDDLESWINKNIQVAEENNLSKPTYIVSQKFDGASINLTYEGGKFIKASTRGTGEVGENVTSQVKTIKTIPLSINDDSTFEIRGEIIMTKDEFLKYNENSDIPLKNLRNGASGALRNLDVKETKKRNLSSFLFDIGYFEKNKFNTYNEMLMFLKENKFKCADYKHCLTFEEIKEEIERIKILREDLNYDIDGVVIAINELNLRDILGYTVKHPKFSMAFKFEAVEEITKLLDVEWNVSRSGRISPTGILEPIDIGGITIKRATLNNVDDIKRKNVKINGNVLIRRSNDVIPEIMKGIDDGENLKHIEIPTKCPSCNSNLIRNGAHIYCTNTISCKPQIIKSIVHFTSRDAMNIEGVSDKIANQFYEELNVKRISDLYTITLEDLLKLDKFKEKKANNILNAINQSKKCNLANFIYALGIRNVGIKTSKDIVKKHKTLDKIINLTKEELEGIYGIGDIVVEDILEFFKNSEVLEEINRLKELGFQFEVNEEIEVKENEFLNKNVVVTGTMENFSRTQMKEIIEKLGGKVTESVSKKTDYVIAGSNAGSKLTKAESLGIKVISENDFNEICEKIGI